MKNAIKNIFLDISKIILLWITIFGIEIIFSFITINNVGNVVLKLLLSLNIALVIDFITSLFEKKKNKVICIVIIFIMNILFVTYFLYYKLLGNILSINTIINGVHEATPFIGILLDAILKNWYICISIIIIPFVFGILPKEILFKKQSKKTNIIKLIIIICIYIITLITIIFTSNSKDVYSNKNLYFYKNNLSESIKQLGLYTTIRLDIQKNIFGSNEKMLIKTENSDKIIVIDKEKYNVKDINFEQIKENTDNEDIKEICNYLETKEPTSKNEYTGKFKGKNLIVFVAESFSNLAIREDVTPTLYKLKNEGIQFTNFYTPLFPVSTADGEYLTDTSLLPSEKEWSIENVYENVFPYTYGNILKNEGYSTQAYHNYDYQYYKRDLYIKTMGYNSFLAKGNGLEKRMDFSEEPSSDYEMVKATMDDYINDERFVAYYMTFSGHRDYNIKHAMVAKNWDYVKDLPYSDTAKAYLASQIELDKAVQEVVNRLKEANKLKDTVILITADHYPYGLTLDQMQELSDKELDDTFEKYNMPFILYNGEEENKISTDKYCCSLDVLPTVLNLFGVDYDSRLLMGKDVFSDSEPLVIFSDRSFISKEGRYNMEEETYTGKEVPEDYIYNKEEEIYNLYRYSRLILENNFYKYIMNYNKLS